MLKKHNLFYIFIILFTLLNVGLIFATNSNIKNTEDYFRIHVVANSDSIDDQILKLKVAKTTNEYIKYITKTSKNKNEYKKIITENIQNILNIANNEIKNNNYNYTVKAYIRKYYVR